VKNSNFSEAVEGYYLETVEGLYFAIKGLEHPPDRRIAVLRYAPDSDTGTRCKNGVLYRRLYSFPEQEKWIAKTCPHYLVYDPVFGTALQSVPRSMIRQIHDPRLKLPALIQSPDRHALEDDVVDFLSLLQKEASVPLPSLGITGSILIGMHTDRSDMDVVVFGETVCIRVHKALRRLLDTAYHTGLKRLDPDGMKELYAQRAPDSRMDFREFESLEKVKANQGQFRGRTWFIRFVKNPDEAWNRYGEFWYEPYGRVTVEAAVTDDHEAIFTPCRYLLSEVRCLESEKAPDLHEIVSFRGRFCEQARAGNRILAAGTLERIRDSRGRVRHRLLLGNSPEDTMVVIR
jgi:predicted nucleotidyltransferase